MGVITSKIRELVALRANQPAILEAANQIDYQFDELYDFIIDVAMIKDRDLEMPTNKLAELQTKARVFVLRYA